MSSWLCTAWLDGGRTNAVNSMQTMDQLLQAAWGLVAAAQSVLGLKDNPGGTLVVNRARVPVHSKKEPGGGNGVHLNSCHPMALVGMV